MGQYWVWFAELRGISHKRKMALLKKFENPKAIYDAGQQAIFTLYDPTGKEWEALQNPSLDKAQAIVAQCKEKGIGILPVTSKLYPQLLRQIDDPPIVLYFKGLLPRWETFPAVGIVGTRSASAYGMQCAYQMGAQVGACGGLVVSGGALGVDAMAMDGALRQGYPAVGVLGCGVDVVYPPTNRPLFEALVQNGCLLSEYAPGTSAYPSNLARRNRLISGISNALVVVEAPAKSGALITAKYAAQQGRDVFVVPGNVDNTTCAGSNALLQNGASVAMKGYDVVGLYKDQFPDRVRNATIENVAKPEFVPAKADKKPIDKRKNGEYSGKENLRPLTGDDKLVYDLLSDDPILVDVLIARSGIGAARVLVSLTKLTIAKRIINHPGKFITKR